MKRKVRVLSLFLACMLCVVNVTTVKADELDEIQEKIEEQKEEQEKLENQKKEAKEEKAALKQKLNTIVEEMEEAKEKLEEKQVEIQETQDALDAAKIDERKQYSDMKLRIQFMYENGDADMIELLCESKSITELLNKAEYIQQTSDYDRQKLVEFQDVIKEIEETEEKLAEEEAELETLQNNLISKKKEVNELLEEANLELANLEKELGASEDQIEELLAEAEEAKRRQLEAQQQASTGGGTAGPSKIIGDGELAWPTDSTRVTSTYGWREIPVAGATANHDAIDIGASIGSPVYAAAAGTVITASWGYNGGRGVYIMIDHGNGLVTRYQHLSDMYVSVGDKVSKGQNIAAVGNTGASSGPHLDFAVYVNGSTVDPLSFY